ncbi:unnamed protein product [Rotaria sp. Silwood1]|nr:unnamed protein product [Rotaria sp. Silwood1]
MVNRAHTQTNRSNLGRVLSIGRSRTRHVTVRSFSEMPKVSILQSKKFNFQHVSVTRKIRPALKSTCSGSQKSADVGDSLEPVKSFI